MTIEDVETLMADTADAIAYEQVDSGGGDSGGSIGENDLPEDEIANNTLTVCCC